MTYYDAGKEVSKWTIIKKIAAYNIFLLDTVAWQLEGHISYDGQEHQNGDEIGNETQEWELRQWDTENLVLVQSTTEQDDAKDEV